MPEFRSGAIDAGEALSRERYRQQQMQEALQMMAIRQWIQQQNEETKRRQDAAKINMVQGWQQGMPPPDQAGPQTSVPPGVSSPPIQPPQGAPPPMAPGMGGGLQALLGGGGPPTGMMQPQPQIPMLTQPGGGMPPPMAGQGGAPVGAPSGAAPQPGMGPQGVPQGPAPPQGYVPGKTAPPEYGGKPPGALPDRTGVMEAERDWVGKTITEMKKMGKSPLEIADALEEMKPYHDQQSRQQFQEMQLELRAQAAALSAYRASLEAARVRETEREHRMQDEARTQRLQFQKNRLNQAAGGASNLKSMEYIYPKGPDGLPDESQPPIGSRGVTKAGKIITLDAEGNQTGQVAGGTAKEGAHVRAQEATKKRLDQMDTNSLLSEYRALSQNLTRSKEDNARMKELEAEIKRRNLTVGGAGKVDKAKLTQQAHEAIDAGKDEAQVRARYKAMTGEDLK